MQSKIKGELEKQHTFVRRGVASTALVLEEQLDFRTSIVEIMTTPYAGRNGVAYVSWESQAVDDWTKISHGGCSPKLALVGQ